MSTAPARTTKNSRRLDLESSKKVLAAMKQNSSTIEDFESQLDKLIESGELHVSPKKQTLASLLPTPPQQLPPTIAKESAAERKKRTILALREEFKHLDGVKIGRSAAALKYGVADTSISNWEKQKLITGEPLIVVYNSSMGRGNQIMLNECHVAAMVAFNQRNRNGKKGGPIAGFNDRPRPTAAELKQRELSN